MKKILIILLLLTSIIGCKSLHLFDVVKTTVFFRVEEDIRLYSTQNKVMHPDFKITVVLTGIDGYQFKSKRYPLYKLVNLTPIEMEIPVGKYEVEILELNGIDCQPYFFKKRTLIFERDTSNVKLLLKTPLKKFYSY